MRKFKLLLMLFSAVLVLTNCSSNDDHQEGRIIPGTPSSFQSIRDAALQSLVQDTTFQAEKGIEFASAKGVKLRISGGCLYSNGIPVTGDVKLEYVELFDRGNMLVTNKPLMGKDNSGNLVPLVTGGEFYINVTKDGKDLTACYYELIVPAELTDTLNGNMSLWAGTINEDGDLEWDDETSNDKDRTVFPNGQNNTYNVFCSDFGWINIDILSGEPGEKTPILVRVPDGYDNKNAAVYVVYKGRPGMLAYLDVYDPETKLFTEHYGWGPIGFNFYVIFVSVSNDSFVYSIKDVVLEKGKIIVFEESDLKTLTKDELVALINQLK
jgi:hypothetical protein